MGEHLIKLSYSPHFTFRNSLKDVIECNERQVYRCTMTQFVDLTLPEKKKLTGLQNITDVTADSELTFLEARSVPDTMDWRDHGAVTSVKNQGINHVMSSEQDVFI